MTVPVSRLRRAAEGNRLSALIRDARREDLPELVLRLKAMADEAFASRPLIAERAGRAAAQAGDLSGDARSRALGRHVLGKAHWVHGRHAAAAEAFREARRAYRRAGDREGEASVLLARVTAHALLGEARAAAAAGRSARRLFGELGDEVGLAKLSVNLANLHHRQDRPARAIPLYREARETFGSRGMEAEAGAVALNLANVLALLDEYREAEDLYGEAMEALEGAGLPAQAAQAGYNLAYLHFLDGRYREALEGFERAAEVFEELGDPVHRGLCRLDRAEVYLQLQLFPEAEEEAAAAREAFGILGMEYETAKAGAFHALARRGRGFQAGVDEALQQARGKFRRLGNQTWVGVVDLHRAGIALEDGQDPQARRLARSALRIFREARLPVRAAAAQETLGRAEGRGGDEAAAGALLRASLGTARRSGAHWMEVRVRLSLGRSLRRAGRLRPALEQVDGALSRLESLHATAPPGAWEASLAKDRAAAYREAAALCFELVGRGDEEAHGRAFLYAERARARTLVDRLAFLQAAATRTGDAEGRRMLDRLTRLRQDLWWRRSALERGGREEAWRSERGTRLAREVRDLEKEAEGLLERVTREHAEYLPYRDLVVSSPDEVRECLPPDTAFLEYLVGEEETALFIVDREGFRVRRLGTRRADLLRSLQGLQFQMNKFGLGAGYARRHRRAMREEAERHLRDLGDLLLAGLRQETSASRWVVAPHDLLHYVPFHALRPEGDWLMEEREVSVVPSASALRLSLGLPAGRTGATSLVMGVGGKGIPAVRREVEEVSALLPGASLLRDGEATWPALREQAGNCRFLHISTHGIYRPDNPGASALRLADRWLTVREVAGLRLRSDLVVLSACHTGLNRILSGDEQVGLGRAFLQAGAPCLVTTLWAVHDEAMAAWMGDFYKSLLGSGGGPARALRQASLLARERDPHPYFWAPCVLTGRPGPGGGVSHG